MLTKQRNNGVILIIVLWFVALITIIVATLASETRLSAKIVYHNKVAVHTWNDILHALRAAEMELLINKMPDPPGEAQEIPLNERQNKNYQFDGRVLNLAYPIPETVTVRIYNHAAKINLLRLPKQRFHELLEKRIGNDFEKLEALEDAWQDWIDRDDFKHVNGAEKDYYETLSPPYEPRNARLETVEELLLIKGFAEVFKDVEMDNAFTVHGNKYQVNPNLATREALMLLPGLDEESINMILTIRREKELQSVSDLNEFMSPEQLAELGSWFNYRYITNIYTIAVQIKEDSTDTSIQDQWAYMETVHPKGNNKLPQILMVKPYGVLPDTRQTILSK